MLPLDLLHVVLDLIDVLPDLLDLLEELVHLAPVHVDPHVIPADVIVVALGLEKKKNAIFQPLESGSMKNTWAIHQLLTTVNFGTKNRIVNWFTGGLNHQVEHHIFPHISHIHYTKISKIVKQTAKEFNLPYHEYQTTRKAIISHFKHLKHLGQQPALQY